MPLSNGCSRASMSDNIAKLVDEGYPQKQAVAIAYSTRRRAGCSEEMTGPSRRRERNPIAPEGGAGFAMLAPSAADEQARSWAQRDGARWLGGPGAGLEGEQASFFLAFWTCFQMTHGAPDRVWSERVRDDEGRAWTVRVTSAEHDLREPYAGGQGEAVSYGQEGGELAADGPVLVANVSSALRRRAQSVYSDHRTAVALVLGRGIAWTFSVGPA